MNPIIKFKILQALAHYQNLDRAQIQDLCLPGYSPRAVRHILLLLLREGLVNRTHMETTNPHGGAPAPSYYPSRKGCDLLVEETKDERFFTVSCQRPDWRVQLHTLKVSDFHIRLDRALATQQAFQLESWLGEADIANPDEKEPHKRYKLYTLLRAHPRLVCAADAGFALTVANEGEIFRRAYYLEMDRSTSGIQQIAASKTPGYAELALRKLHERHFPGTQEKPFVVLLVTDTAKRRDALRKAISSKQGAALWRFGAWPDINADSLLHEPIWRNIEDQPVPLVKRLETESAVTVPELVPQG